MRQLLNECIDQLIIGYPQFDSGIVNVAQLVDVEVSDVFEDGSEEGLHAPIHESGVILRPDLVIAR